MIAKALSRASRLVAAALAASLLALLMLLAVDPSAYAYDKDGNPVVVSLGDSYSSGEGIEEFYDQGMDKKDKAKSQDWAAHRSTESWSGQLKIKSQDGGGFLTMRDNKGENWFFAASSGAEVHNLWDKQGKRITYKAGLPVMFPTVETDIDAQLGIFDDIEYGTVDYVTLTFGGNDVGFVPVITEAATTGEYLKPNSLVDKLDNIWVEFHKSGGVRENLKKGYRAIAEKAGPQAKIIVAGYPKLLYPEGVDLVFSVKEANLINESVTEFNYEIRTAVEECRAEGIDIYFVSVEDAFDGHGAYASDSYINGIETVHEQDLDCLNPISAYSIHPNKKGAEAYASCVQKMIDDIDAKVRAGEDPGTLMIPSQGAKDDPSSRDIVVALDISGSMEGEPLQETKTAAREFFDAVFDVDASVSLVSYSSSAFMVLPSSTDSIALKSAIRRMNAGGNTNIEDALRTSYEQIKASGSDKRIIVLMSDGEANAGLTGDDLIEYANTIKADGVTIYTLGFFDKVSSRAESQRVMEGIASTGCHYEVSDASDLRFFFGDIASSISGTQYMFVRIACPVDIRVEAGGEALDSSELGLSTRTSFGSLTFEDSQDPNDPYGVKVLRLKQGPAYSIEINGVDSGSMTCSVGLSDENGDYTDMRTFNDVPVADTMSAEMIADDSSATTLRVDEDGDGLYEATYTAKANSTAELADSTRLTGAVFAVAIALSALLGALYVWRTIRRWRRAGA